jgi:thioredoxin reductase (NADPH)
VQVIGLRLEPEHHALRDFLTRAAQPHEFFEVGSPEADRHLVATGLEDLLLPVLIDGENVIAPATIAAVVEAWNESTPPSRETYDLIVVGAGPAGLAAAVYAASDGLSTLVVERDLPGGQASHTSMIENFFGFPEGIGGAELARLAGRQAERFGAELALLRSVEKGGPGPDGLPHFRLADGYKVTSRVAIAATGMDWRRLDVDGVEELLGRGVYYGAGRSEAAQCSDDDVVVIGAGNSAGQAVLNLSNAGARTVMLVRGDGLGKTMSQYLVDRIETHPLITLRLRTEVEAVHSEDRHLVGVTVTGGERLPAQAMFVCIGGMPCTGWAHATGVETDEAGYVYTGPDLLDHGERPASWPLDRDPLALETSIPGLFAAGDLRHGSIKRVGGAVGEGAMAVALAHRRLEELEAAAS